MSEQVMMGACLSLGRARKEQRCRICGESVKAEAEKRQIGQGSLGSLILNYGAEFAHEKCLKATKLCDVPLPAFDGSRRFKVVRVPAWMLLRWLTAKVTDPIRDGKAWLVGTDLPKDAVIVSMHVEYMTDMLLVKLWHPSWPVARESLFGVAGCSPLEFLDVRFHEEAFALALASGRCDLKVDPLNSVIGIGEGPTDGADNHDKYLVGTELREKLRAEGLQLTEQEKAPAGHQFVVRFKCGCCVRFSPSFFTAELDADSQRSNAMCDMANGCHFSEEVVQKALEMRSEVATVPARVPVGGPRSDVTVTCCWEEIVR
jgi:hypothetical protein